MNSTSEVSDEAVQKSTGKTWSEWFTLIDDAGGREMSHKQIVAYLNNNHDISGWWQQMVTVTYEKAHGLREKHEMPDGFQVSRSKTLVVPLNTLYQAWAEVDKRQKWLPENLPDVRLTSPGKSIWLTWTDGQSQVNARFTTTQAEKSQVTVRHTKLPDADTAAAMKSYWAEALNSLQTFLG